jgi:hypothetical protein
MKKIVWTFGLVAGGILAVVIATMPLYLNGTMNFDHAEITGYTVMVLAFVLVFFGIRSYRENVGGGAITFGKAFQVGILVTLIACTVYVATWEIVYFNFLPDFADKYAALTLEKMRTRGATEAAIAKTTEQMAQFKVWYKNPLLNAGMTYLEVLPVGLLVTLVSAAILRKKAPAPSAA